MKKLIIITTILLSNPILHSDWFSTSSGTANTLLSVLFINPLTGYACGSNGTIVKTTNGGNNWVNLSSGTVDFLTSLAMNPSNSSIIYSAGDNGTILKTTNSGANWSKTNIGGLYNAIIFKDMNTGVVAGLAGFMYRTTNGGNNWVNIDPGIGLTTIYVFYTAGNSIFGGCASGKIIKSTNNGLNWSSYQTPSTFGFYCLYFSDVNTGFAVDATGDVYKSTNSGVNWVQISSHSGTKNAIITNGIDIFMCGVSGQILKSTNSGVNWILQTTSTQSDFNAMQFVTPTTGFAVGENGAIYKTTNGGEPIGIHSISSEIPESYTLSQNYPNPFNPVTNIEFSIPEAAFIRLTIYDITGRKVAEPVNQKLLPGSYNVDFNAEGFNSGVYFYRLTAGNYSLTKKMILVK